jgi:hypothetical protein
MDELNQTRVAESETGRYEPPSLVVISLDCEITAYAPDGDQPLF